MKTYTIEQIKKYITSQDSLGDVLYNLKNIDKYIINTEVEHFVDEDDAWDYICDLEEHQGEKFSISDTTYEISDDVTDFIRDYGRDTFSQMVTRDTKIKELLENGLIEKI